MLSKEISDSQFQVGRRISSDGEVGTVKFIGEIQSQEGVWLGIEWDNPSRGKHSGTYKNVPYFQTSIPNAGSFIRTWKAETGITCPEAVKKRYGKVKEDELADSIDLPQKSGQVRLVEMVGFEKVNVQQSQFHRLTEIVVSLMLVNGPGDPGELTELLPNVTSLDLSHNLLVSWSQVADITRQFAHLHSLVLSKNRLRVENQIESYKEAFSPIKTLVLNGMSYTWSDIVTLGTMWPYVEDLYVSKNHITTLEQPPFPILSNLHSLNLDDNSIASWREILNLGTISSLQELYLNSCRLDSIAFPNTLASMQTELFPNLYLLHISDNQISKWTDIAELSKLQKLKDLRVTNNPVVFSVNNATARQLVTAKILGLERLNRTEITKGERRDSEFDYIKRYHREWIQKGDVNSSMSLAAFSEEHPTYVRLLQKHGSPEESEINTQTSVLKNNLLSVQIFSSLMPNKPPIVKKLPATMPICKVKGLVQRIFSVSARDLKLTCLSSNSVGLGMDMDNDLRQLSFYSICDGDKIDVRW